MSGRIQAAASMLAVGCPHCRQMLRVGRDYAGRKVACPKCRGILIVPKLAGLSDSSNSEDESTALAIGISVVGVDALAGLLVYAGAGAAPALLTVFAAALVEVGIWKRKPLIAQVRSSLQQFVDQQAEKRSAAQKINDSRIDQAPAAQPSSATASQDRVPAVAKKPNTEPLADLVLKSIGAVTARRRERVPIPPPLPTPSPSDARSKSVAPLTSPLQRGELIPPPKNPGQWRTIWGGGFKTLSRVGANLPPHGVQFFGSGTALQLDRGTVNDPLVYATGEAQHGSFDASLIDGSLPVAAPNATRVPQMPYWPTYHDASPQQRSRYLDWLTTGKCDPQIEIGYVFIYFYGLERRVLVDRADFQAIADEILRLRTIYTESRSFQRYSTSLLWMILSFAGRQAMDFTRVLERLLTTTSHWDVESLGGCLAYLHDAGVSANGDWAFVVAQQDHRVPKSVIVRRHEKLFRELFLKKFAEQFPQGLTLKSSKRKRTIAYRPASSTLANEIDQSWIEQACSASDVLAIESQFKPLVSIWSECIDELRAYDKAHRAGGELSTAAYEALPDELRTGDHPDFDNWFALWRECENAENVPIVPMAKLAALKGIAERATLLKSQCTEITQTATCVGIGIEPDFRMLGRNYRWDDKVTLFFLDDTETSDSATYQAASALLQLGLYVGEADGVVDTHEMTRITQHIEDQFDLSANQSRRLEALRALLSHTKPDPGKVFTALKKRLSEEQRLVVGEYLVGIAAADQVITTEERLRLNRIFSALALPESKLQFMLQPIIEGRAATGTTPSRGSPKDGRFFLDPHAISRIMQDTDAVAGILKAAMAEDEAAEQSDERDSEATISPNVAEVDKRESSIETSTALLETPLNKGIVTAAVPPARYRVFFEALVIRAEWSEADAKKLARDHNLMLSGAVEALNEWSQENWNDWLIEEGEPLRVRLDLLERNAR